MNSDCRQLLQDIAAKKREAIVELYETYQPRFYGYFLRHRLSTHEAEDLVQDVFVKIVQNAGTFRGEAPAEVWLWTIARNTFIERYRQQTRLVEVGDEQMLEIVIESAVGHDVADGYHCYATKEFRECVQRGFSAFARKHNDKAQTLALLAFHGWSMEELGHFIGRKNANATKEYVSQCRKAAKQFLEVCRELLESVSPTLRGGIRKVREAAQTNEQPLQEAQ